MISYGMSSGPVTDVNLGILAAKGSLFVTFPALYPYAVDQKTTQAMADEVFDMIPEGKIEITVNQRYHLKDIATAHDSLESRKTTGSTVLYPDTVAHKYNVL